MSETKIQLNERKIRNGARRGAIKGNRTMRHKTWQKLKSTKKRIKIVAPPHISFCSETNGMVYYGTDKPFVREEYKEEDYTVWVDEWE